MNASAAPPPGPGTSARVSSSQAADILGVKIETVYAYVSRGLLQAIPASDRTGGRRSEFDRRTVEQVAARHRRGGRAGALEVHVETELTMLDPAGRLYYRGHDAGALARTSTFEDVAALLWDTAPDDGTWTLDGATAEAISAAVAATTGPATTRMDRTRLALTVAAGFDPARADRRVEHVRSAGRTMIAAGVHAQPRLGDPVGERIVHRLWASLSPRAPSDAELATTDAALVLLADHELAPSTLAARVAASAWSDPYLVALAGLAAVSGSLHGRTSTPAAHMLQAAIRSGDPRRAVAEAAGAADASLPGFGHKVYVGTDPRAETLLDLVADLDSPRWPLVDATLTAGTRFTGHDANVDFALAAFVVCAELPDDAGELVFGLARLAGVVGHAIEEYRHRLRFRPRAVYTGASPFPADRDGDGPT